jgi:beta-exotoxin I transport system permease protein
MRPSVFLKTLRDARRGFAWWSVGLVGLTAMMVSVYPSVHENAALNKLVRDYPKALRGFLGLGGALDYTSASGYLSIELFSFVVPLLLIIAAIAAGSGAIAGEEERGTLDLLLSLPVTRTRVVLEKLSALAVELAALGLVLWLALVVGARSAGMEIGAGKLAAATVNAVVLAIVYGALALLLGCATGRRGASIGVAAAAAVGAYVLNSLAPLAHVLAGGRKLSPFYYYAAHNPLRVGLEPLHLLVLVAAAAVLSAAAVAGMRGRDLRP